MNSDLWWYAYKQIHKGLPGQAIASGPFDSVEKARNARDRAKNAWDSDVGAVFSAPTQKEADKKAKLYL